MRKFLYKVLLFAFIFFLVDKASYFILIRFKDKVHDHRMEMLVNGLVTRFLWTARIKEQHMFPVGQSIDAFDTVRFDGSQTIRHHAAWDFEHYKFDYNRENELAWKIGLMDEIEDHCREAGVPLIFVYPPNYKDHNPEFVTRIKELASDEVIHFVYNYQDSSWQNKDLFYDADHMHISGARKFTNEIIGFLDSISLK